MGGRNTCNWVTGVGMGTSLHGAQKSILPGRERSQDLTLLIGFCPRLEVFQRWGKFVSVLQKFFLSPIANQWALQTLRDAFSAGGKASEVTDSSILNAQNLLLLHDLQTHVSIQKSTLPDL